MAVASLLEGVLDSRNDFLGLGLPGSCIEQPMSGDLERRGRDAPNPMMGIS